MFCPMGPTNEPCHKSWYVTPAVPREFPDFEPAESFSTTFTAPCLSICLNNTVRVIVSKHPLQTAEPASHPV